MTASMWDLLAAVGGSVASVWALLTVVAVAGRATDKVGQ